MFFGVVMFLCVGCVCVCCMGRRKGCVNRDGYRLSVAALNERFLAPLKDGSHSVVFERILDRELADPEFGRQLRGLKLEFWKKTANTPMLVILDVASELYAFIELERLKHAGESGWVGVLDPKILSATKILADLLKEASRVSEVSADKKVDFLIRKDDLEFDVPVSVKGKVVDVGSSE